MELTNEIKVIDESRQGEAISLPSVTGNGRKLYIESYGCAMNFSDSEIVASILIDNGYTTTKVMEEADVIFINTCAIRDNAEQRIRGRLKEFRGVKKKNRDLVVGVLGCMAERLKTQLLEEEKIVDIVVGPDAYRDLPNLVAEAETGQKAVNVQLSKEETYADISPVRLNSNGITAFISITRGCDNMCSFCVVPFTRGRERSRNPESIVNEARELFEAGYKEVTLLGQNVDSYQWTGGGLKKENPSAEELENATTFAQLLEKVALISPELRVRFSTSHPKDMLDDVLYTMAKYDNICNSIHLPVQSGSTRLLEMMNRGYTREWYIERINAIRRIMPDCGITTDIITGFCSETDEDHQETLSLMEWAGYDFAYMYKYSERPKTLAQRKYPDDVSEELKGQRLTEVINLQTRKASENNKRMVGKVYKVLVEGFSKRSEDNLVGRNDQNRVLIFPKENFKPGDYVNVLVEEYSSATLKGRAV